MLYIGLMSGTSLDGIDAALVDFSANQARLVEFVYLPLEEKLKNTLQRVSKPDTLITLKEYGALDVQVGHIFAEAVNALLTKASMPVEMITAIGSHGVTVQHNPNGHFPFSLQIGDPNIIAELTGITTVADFRRRDLAAGGQGAPLVPAFHRDFFYHPEENRCIINIGGIANVSVLPWSVSKPVIGFDTGPGNTLMDLWIKLQKNLPYDNQGAWAATGTPIQAVVNVLTKDAYFANPPPKSTGKEYFSLPWLYQYVDAFSYQPEDVQASLCLLTATTIVDAINQFAPDTERTLICGGGAHNALLMKFIQQQLNCKVESTEKYGMHPDHVEAIAFAWLAKQALQQQSGNLMEVTGARRQTILGGIYWNLK